VKSLFIREQVKTEQVTKEQDIREQAAEAVIDPQVVGDWITNVVIDGKDWKLRLNIHEDETFQLSSSTEDVGTYTALNGRWSVRSAKGETDGGVYQTMGLDSLSMTGKLGTAIWTRSGASQSRDPRSSIDPFVFGTWKTNAVIKGVDFQITFEMAPNGTYRVFSLTEDSGTFHAKNGRCEQISRKGQRLECSYQVISKDSISLTGPLGTAVWSRVSN
jgi:hypothetical protein